LKYRSNKVKYLGNKVNAFIAGGNEELLQLFCHEAFGLQERTSFNHAGFAVVG
jgi:hypothetical protein